jgi:hypothetical protein
MATASTAQTRITRRLACLLAFGRLGRLALGRLALGRLALGRTLYRKVPLTTTLEARTSGTAQLGGKSVVLSVVEVDAIRPTIYSCY